MEENEMIEQPIETENVDTQTTEEIEEELDFTDTKESKENNQELETETETETKEETDDSQIAPVKKIELTQEELDKKIQLRLGRAERSYEKELAKRDAILEKLKVGMNKENLDEIDNELTSFYEKQGIKMPTPKMSERDEKILAEADAQEIIDSGFEEMERVANELAIKGGKGLTNLNIREKSMFDKLVNQLTIDKAKTDLSKIGVDAKILEDTSFKEFAGQFSPTTPIVKIHEMYTKLTKPQTPQPKPLGSVKTNVVSSEIKEYYTPEEISKFTMQDYLNNPKLMEAVENSLAVKK